MFKNIGLKNSLIASIFGFSMIAALTGCGEEVSNYVAFNDLSNSDYTVVQLKNSQFEVLSKYNTQIKYENDGKCSLNDEENDIYVYAVDNSKFGVNSKSTDGNIINALNMHFIAEEMKIETQSTSVRYEDEQCTKILFNDLNVSLNEKNYVGKLAIIDYGNIESFVFAYSDSVDKIDMDYMMKSLKALDTGGRILVVDNVPETAIDNLDVTYDKFLEKEKENEVVEEVIVEEVIITKEDADKLLGTTKTFKGDFYSFSAYYGIEKAENEVGRQNYYFENDIARFGIDIIDVNRYLETIGEVKDDVAKIEFVKSSLTNIDFTEYKDEEILSLYNIVASKTIFDNYLKDCGLENSKYVTNVVDYNGVNYFVVNGFDGEITKEKHKKSTVTYAFTVDENGHVFMVSFIYTNTMDKVVGDTLSSISFKELGTKSINEEQASVFKEIFDVQ